METKPLHSPDLPPLPSTAPKVAAPAASTVAIETNTSPKSQAPVSWKARFAWPRLWEYTLAFILGVCALFVAQAAWRLIRPPEPLAAALGSIDLNTADVAALKQLPGIGPHLAARIVEHREKHGSFNNVDELRSVSGIGPVSMERLRPLLYVTKPESNEATTTAAGTEPKSKNLATSPSSTVKKTPEQLIDLNTAAKEQLTSIPGIGATIAERIIEDRKTNGLFKSVSDLTRIKGIKAKTVEKLSPYVKVGTK